MRRKFASWKTKFACYGDFFQKAKRVVVTGKLSGLPRSEDDLSWSCSNGSADASSPETRTALARSLRPHPDPHPKAISTMPRPRTPQLNQSLFTEEDRNSRSLLRPFSCKLEIESRTGKQPCPSIRLCRSWPPNLSGPTTPPSARRHRPRAGQDREGEKERLSL